MYLFQGRPVSDLLQTELQAAARSVEGLGLTELSNPALAGWVEKLWAQHLPDIPVIFPDRRRGTKRPERVERDDYGRRIVVDVTYLDVVVPFKGDGNMFNVMPSTSSVIQVPIDVGHEHLTYSLPFDEASDETINGVFSQIERNLKQMRTDVETFCLSAVKQLLGLAANRKTKLEADDRKASKLSFPVD
jgi:hypothetical protein